MPLVAATGLSVAAMLPATFGAAAPDAQIWALRIAAVLLGAGASFALVDLMAPLTMTPAPRWLQQWLRTAIAVVPATVVWLTLYLLANASTPVALPFRELATEAAVCFLGGLVAAAVAARVGHSATTALAGPAVQGTMLLATLFLTGKYSPWPLPESRHWSGVHEYWLWALPILVSVLFAANREVWPLRRAGPVAPKA
ncbi:hypothetical protein [Actinoplanes friuliensis]|uniref:hypothetical protein n=1 Tax=Actinoplanes friuliensis TaxID=196914 RepID=UPI0011DC8D62|nr:hypothetical protein [Actinoplanes friuliensis]